MPHLQKEPWETPLGLEGGTDRHRGLGTELCWEGSVEERHRVKQEQGVSMPSCHRLPCGTGSAALLNHLLMFFVPQPFLCWQPALCRFIPDSQLLTATSSVLFPCPPLLDTTHLPHLETTKLRSWEKRY